MPVGGWSTTRSVFMFCITSRVAAVALSVLVASASLQAQQKETVRTGTAAAQLFVYAGHPIHPFCLDFPYGSDRSTPIELARCNDTPVQAAKDGTQLSADYPNDDGGFRHGNDGAGICLSRPAGARERRSTRSTDLLRSTHTAGREVEKVRTESHRTEGVRPEVPGYLRPALIPVT